MRLTLDQAIRLLDRRHGEDAQGEAWRRGLEADDSEQRLFWFAVCNYYDWLHLLGKIPRHDPAFEGRTLTPAILKEAAQRMMDSRRCFAQAVSKR